MPEDHAQNVRGSRPTAIVSSMASDAHTWNLVFLQLVLEEAGYHVVNLGACVPDELMVDECARLRPALVVMSSVNGHGLQDGLRLIAEVRAHPALTGTQIVIGGKLGIHGMPSDAELDALREAGFDAVFDERAGIAPFEAFIRTVALGSVA